MTVLTVNRLYELSVKVCCSANDTNENNSLALCIYNIPTQYWYAFNMCKTG